MKNRDSVCNFIAVTLQSFMLEIDKAREEVEDACNSLRIDLLVTIRSGCLLAAGITSIPRLFIDPNCLAGEAWQIDTP